jgi:hypothetical protein
MNIITRNPFVVFAGSRAPFRSGGAVHQSGIHAKTPGASNLAEYEQASESI